MPTQSRARQACCRRARSLLLSSSLALAACAGVAFAQSPELSLTDMTFVSSEGEATELILRAERARVRPDTEIAHLEGVHVVFAGEGRNPSFDVRCERGTLDLSTNDFRAEGDVRGVSNDGRKFRTEWVEYDHERARLSTDAPVMMTDAGNSLRGGGFEYLVKEDRFRLTGGAQVVRE